MILGDHALKYRDGREYPLLKGNAWPNQIAQDISPALYFAPLYGAK